MRQKETLAVNIFNADGKLLIDKRKNESFVQGEPKRKESEEVRRIIRQVRKSPASFNMFHEGTIDFWAPVQYETHFSPSDVMLFTDNPRQSTVQTIGFVRVVLDKRQLEDSFRILLLKCVLLTTVLLALVLFFAYFVTKSVTRPLNRLKEGVLALGTGVSVGKIPVESNDEVGKLANAFNEMAESLKMREMEKEQLAEQLFQAQKMEAVGTLAGGVAHDFNNILTAIIGYSHLLQMRTPEDDPSSGYVSQIRHASERAAELTQGLLAFSRKQVMLPQSIDLNEVVERLQKMLRRIVRENIELEVETDGNELIVMADRGKIEQVLMNLVTNACDAISGSGKIALRTCRKSMNGEFLHTHGYGVPGEYVCIIISDTGSGIEEQTKNKIFEPFFTTKEVGKGTGLGLSIVYGIVKQHNGYINVYSEPGKGTIFKIYLPLIEEKIEATMAKTEIRASGGTETVLLAEDDTAVNTFHRTLLEGAGYTVITAVDGEDALNKFAEHGSAIKLLILDVIMPKFNGKNVLDIIRQENPQTKALFMSGYPADTLSVEGFFRGRTGLLMKPVDPLEFLKKVREVLDE
jgi:signal transduction histidine kinase